MQKTYYGLLLISIIAAACSNGKKSGEGNLNDKKAKLEQLKGDQKKINDQIAQLQQEIIAQDPSAAAAQNAKLVAVAAVQTDTFMHYIDLQGKVDARNISYVAPPNGQGGIVKALYVQQGDRVRKGQVLARLDAQLIQQQVEPLKVQLAAAQDTYGRTKNLWDQGIGTYQQVLTAKTQVESLQKQIAIIQRQVGLMTVTAPTSGVADQVNVRVGEAFMGSTAAGPQIRIVNTNDLKVTAQVPENYIGKVKEGSKVEIVLPDQNNRTINATVNVVGKVIDPNTRSFYIEANIPTNVNLKPNQVAKLRIKDYGNTDAITIPVNTLQNDEAGKFVMVAATENGKTIARKRPVTVGELYGNELEVKSGLQQGDQLITEGFQGLYDGQAITTTVK